MSEMCMHKGNISATGHPIRLTTFGSRYSIFGVIRSTSCLATGQKCSLLSQVDSSRSVDWWQFSWLSQSMVRQVSRSYAQRLAPGTSLQTWHDGTQLGQCVYFWGLVFV